MTENCAKCGAPAFGSVNGQGFCAEHVEDVVAEAMKPAMKIKQLLNDREPEAA